MKRSLRSGMIGLFWLLGILDGAAAAPSIARIWDEEILAAIRIDLPHPPAHARNLFHLSVVMYDVWAAYDSVATGYVYHAKHRADNLTAARREAISYGAYRILRERYALSRNAPRTLAALDARMAALQYDTNNFSLDPVTPAGLGNRVAATVSAFFLEDGARQTDGYNDPSYVAFNQPLTVELTANPPPDDINRWQPLALSVAVSQNGISLAGIQSFVGSQWKDVLPFALSRDNPGKAWIDPGPPPQLRGLGDQQFRQQVVEVIELSSRLTTDDGAVIDISPGAMGNNSLGANDGKGHSVNPVTGQPYASNRVKRGDFGRVLAEFWADGPSSETPPGHWNSVANYVTDHPMFVKKFGGQGPVLDGLEWDVKLYFVLNASLHDAACAAWTLKRLYDGWRPICAIRNMGQKGQSSDPKGRAYHPDGLPLVPGLIEVVTETTMQAGAKHSGLPPGIVAVRCWPGQPADFTNEVSGVKWIPATTWIPYQKKTFVTPAFPGYISGHSTFSRAAAEVLTAITGTPFFPGGLATFDFSTHYLTFEKGPSEPIQLQWATYFDAADQAGLSRLWGGIHVSVDDLNGRKTGAECGRGAWKYVQQYFDGSAGKFRPRLQLARRANGELELRCPTLRGFSYRIQSTSDITKPFADEPRDRMQVTENAVIQTIPSRPEQKFYRAVRLEDGN